MTTQKSSPHFLRNKLLKHKAAYVESVGKLDMDTFSDVRDAPDGRGTVLRLILGATATMPLRSITYIDAALRCAQVVPFEQLQIVHANQLGHEVNGVPREEAIRQSTLLAGLARLHMNASMPGMADRVLHATDKPIDLQSFAGLAHTVFRHSFAIASTLSNKGAKHGGNSEVYTAAHFAFQDTDALELSPLLSDSPTQVRAERIVSIGCLQERPFYLARMSMRGLCAPSDMVPSAQIFTRHVSPPYFVARHGEPLLEDALQKGFCLSEVGDPAAVRDLEHFTKVVSQENI